MVVFSAHQDGYVTSDYDSTSEPNFKRENIIHEFPDEFTAEVFELQLAESIDECTNHKVLWKGWVHSNQVHHKQVVKYKPLEKPFKVSIDGKIGTIISEYTRPPANWNEMEGEIDYSMSVYQIQWEDGTVQDGIIPESYDREYTEYHCEECAFNCHTSTPDVTMCRNTGEIPPKGWSLYFHMAMDPRNTDFETFMLKEKCHACEDDLGNAIIYKNMLKMDKCQACFKHQADMYDQSKYEQDHDL